MRTFACVLSSLVALKPLAIVPPHPTSPFLPVPPQRTDIQSCMLQTEKKGFSLYRLRSQVFEMLRRLIFFTAAPLVRDVRPSYLSVRAPLALFSTTSYSPSKYMQTPPPGCVAVPGESSTIKNIEDKRMTGDEVQKAFDPLGNDGRSGGGGCQRLDQYVKEMLIDRE